MPRNRVQAAEAMALAEESQILADVSILKSLPREMPDEELDLLDQMEGWMEGEFEKEDDPLPQPLSLFPKEGSDTTFQFEEFAVHIAGSITGKEALSTRVWRGALVPSPAELRPPWQL